MAKRAKACNCVLKVQQELNGHNAKLECGIHANFNSRTISFQMPILSTKKIDTKKRSKPVTVYCVYCPFCGDKYPE